MATKAGATRVSRTAARLLADSNLLPGLSADAFTSIADHISTVNLRAGDQLFAQGDVADSLYVVGSGETEVVIDAPGGHQHLSHLGEGAVVGEIGLLVGDTRSATVRAVADCELVRVSAHGLRRLLADHPVEAEHLAACASDRLRRTQLVSHFSDLFGIIDASLLATIEALVGWETVRAGARVFTQGDAGDTAYVVASGRLAAYVRDQASGAEIEHGHIGRGEVVGELSVIDGEPRDCSVYAVRDTRLITFSRAAYDVLLSQYPRVGLAIATAALRRRNETRTRVPTRRRSVLLVGVSPALDLQPFASELAEALGRGAAVITSDAIDAELGRPGLAQVEDEHVGALRLAYFLEELEERNEFVVYIADKEWTPWSLRALRSADEIILVADATASPTLTDHETDMWATVSDHHHPLVRLVLLHPPDTRLPQGTPAWLEERDIASHHHVRRGDDAHMARLARVLAGTATAVVLGGGGARGFAHLGFFEALVDRGVSVDMVGGTSIGSIMAIAPAMEWTCDEARLKMLDAFRGLMDYTVPSTSLLRGRRITAKLRENIGDVDITDLWIPYFCVSANVTHAAATYHDHGDLVRAIRASIAIPGVLPPVVIGRELFVDGGIVDNVPVEEMRRRNASGAVIAVDVAPVEGPSVREDYGLDVGGIRAWRARRRGSGPPALMSTMVRASLVASLATRHRIVRDGVADLFLEVPTAGGGLLDFSAADDIIDGAAAAITPALAEWQDSQGGDHSTRSGGAGMSVYVRTEPPRRAILDAARGRRRGGVLLLTLRDLQFRRSRVGAVVAGIAVVLALLFLMTGLTAQFHREPEQTVAGFGASAWILRAGASGAFTSAATMPADSAASIPGASPVVVARHSLNARAAAHDIVVIGFVPDALGRPTVTAGRQPAAPSEVVVDAAADLPIGGTAAIGESTFTVVGLTEDRTMFAGMPLVYMTIDAAQSLIYRGQPLATAALLPATASAGIPAGFVALTPDEIAADATRPLERSISSVNLIRILLWLVAGLIIGTTTYLTAMERRRDVAVLKAVGGSTIQLAMSVALQAALIALAAAVVASGLQLVLAPVFPLEVAVPDSAFVQVPLLAIVVSQLAGAVGLRNAVATDPALAFQGPNA